MKPLVLATLIYMSSFAASTYAAEPICIKTGRQYYIGMAKALGMEGNMTRFKRKFNELSNNLPKVGVMSEFAPSLASTLQMADTICTNYASNNSYGNMAEIVPQIYTQLLRRKPTTEELALVDSGFEGEFEKIFAACMRIGISLEFIKNGKSCSQ